MKVTQLNYILTSLIFQVVYTLAGVHSKLPSFRHNDLHCSNVLISHMDVCKIKEMYKASDYYNE